ncbi:hypothetical protein [Helicobacter sp. MIT 14-3879]|nr:hypothetical protein [Helicobacter sp. MIT 14-3879]
MVCNGVFAHIGIHDKESSFAILGFIAFEFVNMDCYENFNNFSQW